MNDLATGPVCYASGTGVTGYPSTRLTSAFAPTSRTIPEQRPEALLGY